MKYEVYQNSDEDIIFHNVFTSLYDLVQYVENAELSSHAKQKMQVSSLSRDNEFHGIPFKQALELCKYGDSNNAKKFLILKNQLERALTIKTEKRGIITDYAGFAPNIGAYFRGNPKAMYRLKREEAQKFITIYYNCGESYSVKPQQILHKGIITLAFIKLLEENNYRVKFKFFDIGRNKNEISYTEIHLKKEQESINPLMCYFPMTNKAFLRRIMFRITETIDFSSDWMNTYGSALKKNEIEKILKLNDQDILINRVAELGILGNNIYEDAKSYFRRIGLEEYLDIDTNKILTR